MMDLEHINRRYCRPSFVVALMLYAIFVMLAFSVLDDEQFEQYDMHGHQPNGYKSSGDSHSSPNELNANTSELLCR